MEVVLVLTTETIEVVEAHQEVIRLLEVKGLLVKESDLIGQKKEGLVVCLMIHMAHMVGLMIILVHIQHIKAMVNLCHQFLLGNIQV